MDLQAVDSVEVSVLVDNVTDSLSTVPRFVETEFAGLTRRRGKTWVLAGSCLCCAAHGLACLVTVRTGATRRVLLFDSGPEDRTFEQMSPASASSSAPSKRWCCRTVTGTTVAACSALCS